MSAEAKLEEAREIGERIERGDLMIGIMPFEEVEKMMRLYDEASREGSADASFELGRAYLQGIAEPADPEAAVEAFGRAVEQGYGREAALERLRTAYFHAPDVLDDETIRTEIERLCKGDFTGAAHLLRGYFHFRGFGFEASIKDAIEWHTKAAARDNADAMFELSVLYGPAYETADDAKSLEWVQKAADEGSARAMYNLGTRYATGSGVDLDAETAVDWYAKAAEYGHGRSAATVAIMCFTGDEVEADHAKGEEFFVLACELGFDADALFLQLGVEHPF